LDGHPRPVVALPIELNHLEGGIDWIGKAGERAEGILTAIALSEVLIRIGVTVAIPPTVFAGRHNALTGIRARNGAA
jgi:hypothetical protein